MRYLFVLVALFSLSSCQPTMKAMIGFKKIKKTGTDAAIAFKNRLDLSNIYLLDTHKLTLFKDSLKIVLNDTLPNDVCKRDDITKDLSQPIQLMCFDQSGKLVSYIINCHVSGFPNLKWNTNNILESFPPQSLGKVYPEIRLENVTQMITKLEDVKSAPTEPDYTVVVFCSTIVERQSKRLIRLFTQKSLPLKGDKSVQIIYVNNDELFVGL